MICKVKDTIEKYNMLSPGDEVIVALSGGADSMMLLHMMKEIEKEYGLKLTAAHVNHCLRGSEAERDMEFVKAQCEKLSVELKCLVFDVKKEAEKTSESIEECGRRIRYDFFKSISENAKIATAHNLSDSQETFFLNLLRGTGIAGLCGIPPVRDNIIRPLINISSRDIREYCDKNMIGYVIDSTNDSDDYRRNYIRHNIIPAMKKLDSSFDSSMERCFELLKKDRDFILNSAKELIEKSCKGEGKYDFSMIISAPESVRERAVMEIIYLFCKKYPEKKHIDMIFSSGDKSFRQQITCGIYACVKQGVFYLEDGENDIPEYEIKVTGEGEYKVPGGIVKITLCTHKVYKDLLFNCVSCDRIGKNLVLRNRRPGDKITLPGRKVTKTLKKLFCEDNIPRFRRFEICVLSDEKGVVWVKDYGADKRCAANENDERKYFITFVPEEAGIC